MQMPLKWTSEHFEVHLFCAMWTESAGGYLYFIPSFSDEQRKVSTYRKIKSSGHEALNNPPRWVRITTDILFILQVKVFIVCTENNEVDQKENWVECKKQREPFFIIHLSLNWLTRTKKHISINEDLLCNNVKQMHHWLLFIDVLSWEYSKLCH